MAKSKPSAIPEFVGARFISACVALDYKQTQKALHDQGVRLSGERLYRWIDVEDALGRRFIPYDAIERLAQHVDAGSKSTAPFDVSKEVYDLMHVAWMERGNVPAGVLRSRPEARKAKAPAPKGRPAKRGADDEDVTVRVRAQIEADKRVQAEVVQERLIGQREQNELRRIQARRLSGMMCDRATVSAKSTEVARLVSRFMMELPGRVSGFLSQVAAMTDEEINIVEGMLKEELPTFMRELKKGIAEIETAGVEVASAKRYGERTGSDLASAPLQ